MAGHNKWSKVKHIKAVVDAKKGRVFTKLIKEITVAARMGGGNADGNPRLRQAITAARGASMPKDKIETAIKKGTGEIKAESIEEITYEGYGPGGVAIIVETLSDNKNRTVADLRKLFKSGGGNLGDAGCVSYLFDRCGQLFFETPKYTEDQVMEVALEAGAQDVSGSEETIEVITGSTEIYSVKEAFDRVGMHPTSAGLSYLPKTNLKVDDREQAEKLIKMLESIEDHDDVQKVHSNFEMEDSLLKELTTKA